MINAPHSRYVTAQHNLLLQSFINITHQNPVMAREGSVKVGRFSGSGKIDYTYNEDCAESSTPDATATPLAATHLPVVSTIVSGESR
jgi:hypothetical protein